MRRRRKFITLLVRAAKVMEKMMRRFTILVVMGLIGGTDGLAAQETVETRGITSEIRIDEVIFGHMTELNGKFWGRAKRIRALKGG